VPVEKDLLRKCHINEVRRGENPAVDHRVVELSSSERRCYSLDVDRRAVGLSSSGRRRQPLSSCSSVRCATSTFVSF